MDGRRLVADLVCLCDGLDGAGCRLFVAGMHVCEDLPFLDRLAALRAADDADGMVDRVLLRASPAADAL